MSRVEKISPPLVELMDPYVQELKKTMEFVKATKVVRPILFRPLMLGNHSTYFKDGILLEVVRKNRHSDVLAAGGRYALLSSQSPFIKDSRLAMITS